MSRMQLLFKTCCENDIQGNQGWDVLCHGCNFCFPKKSKTKITGTRVGMLYAADAVFVEQDGVSIKLMGTRVGMFYGAHAIFALKKL